MTILLLISLCLIGVSLTILFLLGVFQPPVSGAREYAKQAYLLSPAELAFFDVLLQSIEPDQYVFAKVRIADLVRVNGLVIESRDWWKHFSPLSQKHVDFVVCSRAPVTPLVVFELDDRSHQTARAQARDRLVDQIMQTAGLPIVHIPYDSQGYSRKLLQYHLAAVRQPHAS